MPARRAVRHVSAEKTPEQRRIEALEHARSVVERTPEAKAVFECTEYLRSAEINLQKFRENLEEDPYYALEWSNGAFEAAAKRRILVEVIAHLERHSIRQVIDYWASEAGRVNQFQRHSSTSQTSNHIEECKRVALNEILERLRSIADRHAHAVATLYLDHEEHCASVVLQEQVRRVLNAGNHYYTGA